MIVRELIEALNYPDLLKEDIIESNEELSSVLDSAVIINDGVREYTILSVYTALADGRVYIDIEECADDEENT